MITVAACAFALGAVLGYLAAVLDLHGWLLHAFARALHAQWYTQAQRCPVCGREVHLMRHCMDRAGIFGANDAGLRCLGCSSRHNAPRAAPDRTETAQNAGLGVLGWPGVQAGSPGPHSQDRTDERNEPMQTPTTAIIGDRIEHELMPGFPMLVEASEPCETDCARPEPHRQYQITDPEGNTDWLCAYDVRKVG